MKNKINFITDYILNLSERSQRLNNGDFKIGFDWIIYQYGFAKQWLPIKLPFSRETSSEIVAHKTEHEFGIDLSFYDTVNEEILVFILKAEKLTYSNWISKGFSSDLQRASNPDFNLTGIDISKIKKYKVITVYNKTHENAGISSFNTFVNNSPKTIHNNGIILLSFEIWDIHKLSSEIMNTILTPDILPSNLSGLLSYIKELFNNIDYGTTSWENQVLPNWKNFLNKVFEKGVDKRKIYLIPVSLIILKGDKLTPNSKIAWIDLIEWAILKLWDITLISNAPEIKTLVEMIWKEFYIEELKTYFELNKEVLCSKNGIMVYSPYIDLVPVNTINSTYWHIGKFSILYLSETTGDSSKYINEIKNHYANYLILMINANHSIFYPLIDLHHIEIFLIFIILYQSNRPDDISKFIQTLLNNFRIRRLPNSDIPFIDSSNDLILLAEKITKQIKDYSNSIDSSYLLTMLLEMCLIFEKEEAIRIIDLFFEYVINENKEHNKKSINLIGLIPDKNWEENIFKKQIQEGIEFSVNNFQDPTDTKNKYELIKEYIEQSRKKDIDVVKLKCPLPTYILACIKNQSPLPSEFWRFFIFGNKK